MALMIFQARQYVAISLLRSSPALNELRRCKSYSPSSLLRLGIMLYSEE